jgi:hypothetical protein
MHRVALAAIGLLAWAGAAQADCQKQIQLFGEDVRSVTLTQAQKQDIGGILDDARRYCWVHQENTAMGHIARARRVAGIGPPREEFDWETVPLESLEPKER